MNLKMSYNKFDSFFYLNKIFDFNDALTSTGELKSSFNKDNLFCPECKIAKLRFTSKTSQKSAFLSTCPGSIHLQNCTYSFEAASKREICKYYESLTLNQIQDKLKSYMNHFFKSNTIINHPIQNNDIKINPIILFNSKTKQHKRLPTRSLRSVVHKDGDLLDTPILFYGRVRIELDSNNENDKKYYTIKLKNLKSNTTFLYLRTKLSENFDIKNIGQNKCYQFVFLGIYRKNHKYPYLYNNKSFMIQEIKK